MLGIIPGGTGNGFHRSLKIPGNYHKALMGISAWEPRFYSDNIVLSFIR
ncbi:MAG: hypothetical protein GYA84_00520 [Firmicutes bacterium]|nr:hypothetical protein [Bacillota bacterium]